MEDLQLVTNAPANGTFYLLSAELAERLPPFPYDPYEGGFPLYQLDGFPDSFLVADSPEDFISLQSQQALQRFGGMSTLSAEGPPSPGDGGDTNEWCCPEIRSYGANDLWLEVMATNAGASGVLAFFTIHTPTNAAYDLFATTNLTTNVVGLNLTNWIWLGRIEAGATNVMVEAYWPDMAIFQLGTLLDSDEDGLTDAYELLCSHTSPGSASSPDTDGDGIPDAWEIAHGLNPLWAETNTDPDGDGLSNYQEYLANSDPWSGSMVVAWGRNSSGQCNVPPNLRDVVAVAGGEKSSYALKANGTVVGWGGATNPPGPLTNATQIAANGYGSCSTPTGFGLALSNGVVIQWGTALADPPTNLNNVRGIAAGAFHALALSNDTVVAWGNMNQWAAKVPAGLSDVRAIATGWHHGVALSNNGTVAAWGLSAPELGYTMPAVPSNLTNVAAISAYGLHTLALKSNGTVVAWGYNQCGQTDVPSGLNSVIAVAAGAGHNLALKDDGTVTTWGVVAAAADTLDKVTAIAAGQDHCLAVRTGRLTPVIVTQPMSRTMTNSGAVSFSVTVASLATPTYQWQRNGVNLSGKTDAVLNLTGIATNQAGNYQVMVCNGAGCVTSAAASLEIVIPSAPIVTSVMPPAPGVIWLGIVSSLAVQARADGETFVPISYQWQRNGAALTNEVINSLLVHEAAAGDTYSVVVSNALGSTNVGPWLVRAPEAGGIVAWGGNHDGQAAPPALLTNIVSLAGGSAHGLALTDEGRVYAWGGDVFGETNVPATLTNAIAIAAGSGFSLALKADGNVTLWGRTDSGLGDIPVEGTNVVKIAAGGGHCLALRQDGSLHEWGTSPGSIPANATNVTALAAGADFNLVLRSNGTVVAWGSNTWGQASVPADLTNVVAIAAGKYHALALKQNGTVISWGRNDYGQTNVPTDLTNVLAIAGNGAVSMALRNDGKVRVWGQNDYGTTNAMPGLPLVKAIGMGGATAYVALYSSLVQYPVDVSQDLLLIYNTNSPDSIVVKDYYLQHRPMVSGANVLGIGGPTNDIYLPEEFATNCALTVLDWLASNPTKHPNYVVLFAGIPERVNTNNITGSNGGGAVKPSTSVQLREAFTGVQPFVTHINMGDSNACKAYINKLEFFGTNYSPGRLIISASASANRRFYLDDARNGPLFTNGVSGVLRCGIAASNITYVPAYSLYSEHIFNATNVAGYGSWGKNGQLVLTYALDGTIKFHGDSSWYIIATGESYNGQRFGYTQSKFIDWFSSGAFGGTNYSNTPIGAATHVDEPGGGGLENMDYFFGLWAANRNFAICAWKARITPFFQAVGDPFVVK